MQSTFYYIYLNYLYLALTQFSRFVCTTLLFLTILNLFTVFNFHSILINIICIIHKNFLIFFILSIFPRKSLLAIKNSFYDNFQFTWILIAIKSNIDTVTFASSKKTKKYIIYNIKFVLLLIFF